MGQLLSAPGVVAAERAGATTPAPLPYPLQRSATGHMRTHGAKEDDLARLQAWAGQSARLAREEPAGEILRSIWAEARAALVR